MEDIALLLKKASKVVRCEFNDRLKQHALTQSQWNVLKELYVCKEDCRERTAVKLAKRLNSDKPTMSGIIYRLQLAGWIDVRANPMDGRSKAIYLTEKAKKILEKGYKCDQDTIKKAFNGFTADEKVKLGAMLGKIVKNME